MLSFIFGFTSRLKLHTILALDLNFIRTVGTRNGGAMYIWGYSSMVQRLTYAIEYFVYN